MKNHGAVFLVTAAGLLAVIGGGYGLATITAAPTVRYEEVADWPALPAGVQMGDVPCAEHVDVASGISRPSSRRIERTCGE
jgi:hypothetical protein